MTRYYAIRKTSRKVIGSRTMSLAEAKREVEAWRAGIGPAAVVAADDKAIRRAVRMDDQAVLSSLLRG